MKKVLFRVDAHKKIGLGHLKRCLNIARLAMESGYQCDFYSYIESANLADEVRTSGARLQNLDRMLEIHDDLQLLSNKSTEYDTLVLDGYQYDSQFFESLSPFGGSEIMVVDDIGDRVLKCSKVLNYNIAAKESWYQGSDYSKIYLGMDYWPIVDSLKMALQQREQRQVDKKTFLVTLGGGDIKENLEFIHKTLKQFDFPNSVRVVLVTAGISLEEKDSRIEYRDFIHDFHNFLADVDFCISACGTTIYELLYLGIPTIAVSLAENQKKTFEYLVDQNLVVEGNLKDSSQMLTALRSLFEIQAAAQPAETFEGLSPKRIDELFG